MGMSQPAGSWPACDVWFWRGRSVPEAARAVASAAEIDRSSERPTQLDRVGAQATAGLLRLAAAEFVLGRLTVYDRSTFARGLVVERECPACDDRHGRPRLPIRRLHVAATHATVGDDALVVVAASAAGEVGLAAGAADDTTDVRRRAVVAAVSDGPHSPMPEAELPADVPGRTSATSGSSVTGCWLNDLELGAGLTGAVAVQTGEDVTLQVADAASLLG